MQRIDIAKKIISILDPGLVFSPAFYTGRPPKFSHQQVELLLKLESKLDAKDAKQFFWETIGSSFLILSKPLKKFSALPSPVMFKIITAPRKNIEVCLMAFLRGNRIDEALDSLKKKLFERDATVASIKMSTLSCLNQVLRCEDHLFTDSQLEKVEAYFRRCKALSDLVEGSSQVFLGSPPATLDSEYNKNYNIKVAVESSLSDALPLLKQARFRRVRDELEVESIEINRDKELVKGEIKTFGFSPDLEQCLDRFEKDYHKAKDGLDYKATLGHIRSFMELLTREIARKVHEICGEKPSEPLNKFGRYRSYLRQKTVNFYTEKQDELLGGIFSFASDAGVHPVKSQKEYARLAKNMAIECAVFLFDKLNRYKSNSQGS